MKDKLLKFGSVLVTIILTIAILGRLTSIMELKESQKKYNDFFDQTEDFDVIFAGTSHVINGIYPMNLWDEYGIVSYNFGGHANGIATSYWSVMNALDYTNPKVVVIDCYGISKNTKTWQNYSYLHMNFDSFPLTLTKLETIWDLYDDPVLEAQIASGETTPETSEPRTRIGLLWNYSVYHNRWDRLTQDEFDVISDLEKGATRFHLVAKAEEFNDVGDEKIDGDTLALHYLDKLIEECREKDIDVILTYLPFPAAEKNQREANYLYDYAIEKNVDYLNFLDLNVVDFETDLADSSSHLNPMGASKVTSYIGNFLYEKYGESINHKNDSNYSFWKEDYEKCIEARDYGLYAIKDFNTYLMTLNFLDVEGVIDIRNKGIFDDKQIVELLKSMGVSGEKLTKETDFILIGKGNTAIPIKNFRENGKTEQTEIGELAYFCSEQGEFGLYLDGAELYVSDTCAGFDVEIETKTLNGQTITSIFENQDRSGNNIYRLAKTNSEW